MSQVTTRTIAAVVLFGSLLAWVGFRAFPRLRGAAGSPDASVEPSFVGRWAGQASETISAQLLSGSDRAAVAKVLLDQQWCPIVRRALFLYPPVPRAAEYTQNEVEKILIANTMLHEISHGFTTEIGIGSGTVESEVFARLYELSNGPAPFYALAGLISMGGEQLGDARQRMAYEASVHVLGGLVEELASQGAVAVPAPASGPIAQHFKTLTAAEIRRMATATIARTFGGGSTSRPGPFERYDWLMKQDDFIVAARTAFATRRFDEGIQKLIMPAAFALEEKTMGTSLGTPGYKLGAIEVLEYARSLDRNNVAVAYNLAAAYRKSGSLPEAHAEFERARSLAPANVDVMDGLADVLISMGRFVEAEKIDREHVSRDDRSVRARVALAFHRAYATSFANRAFGSEIATIVKIDPTNAQANVLSALHWRTHHDLDRALAAMRAYNRIAPETSSGRVMSGALLLESGRLEEARVELDEAIRRNAPLSNGPAGDAPAIAHQYLRGDQVRQIGGRLVHADCGEIRTAAPEILASAGVADLPTSAELVALSERGGTVDSAALLATVTGERLFDQGRFTEATLAYREALVFDPHYATARIFLGDAYYAAGDLESAVRELTAVTRQDGANAAAWYFLGDAYQKEGKAVEAIYAYTRSLGIDPGQKVVWQAREHADAVRRAADRPDGGVALGEAKDGALPPRHAHEGGIQFPRGSRADASYSKGEIAFYTTLSPTLENPAAGSTNTGPVRVAAADVDRFQRARRLEEEAQGMFRQQHYAQAAQNLRIVLSTYKDVYGRASEAYAATAHNLAETLREGGEYAAAEPLYVDALDIAERVLGPEDLLSATILEHHARLLLTWNESRTSVAHVDGGTILEASTNFGAAEMKARRALAIREKVLGAKDLNVAEALATLAAVLEARGDSRAAEGLVRRELSICLAVLGRDHAISRSAAHRFADLLAHDGHTPSRAGLLEGRDPGGGPQ